MRSNPYRLKKPCSSCPFLVANAGMILPARVDEIDRSLVRSEFPCHKTVDYTGVKDEDGGPLESRDRTGEAHCAGALILLERSGRPSQMMRISGRLGMYDPTKLDMNAVVFTNFRAMRRAAVAAWKPKAKTKKKGAPCAE